jgi:hypothetical protein
MKERVTPREQHTEQRKKRENRDSLSEKKYMANGATPTAVVIIVIMVVPF